MGSSPTWSIDEDSRMKTNRYSSVVERTALNRVVEGSIPSAGVDEDKINPTATIFIQQLVVGSSPTSFN